MLKSYIVIHHSLTKDSKTVSWTAIRKYHMLTYGWSDIGYNWGIELINESYEIFKGRPEDIPGAHCRDAMMNQRGIGLVLIGNYDMEQPNKVMIGKAVELCKWLMQRHSIDPQYVIGHREAQAIGNVPEGNRKTCPGSKFSMSAFRAALCA